MLKLLYLGLGVLLFIFLSSPVSAIYVPQERRLPEVKTVPGKVIIKLKAGESSEQIKNNYQLKKVEQILKGFNFKGEKRQKNEELGIDRLYVLETDGDVSPLLDKLKKDSKVEYAQPSFLGTVLNTPNDPMLSNLWGLHNNGQTGGKVDADIDAPEAWDVTNGTTIPVAVIDTGVDYTHPDLKDNMWKNATEASGSAGIDDDGNGFVDDVYGYDFANEDPDPFDDYGHGTHVAGTIAATGNNNLGVVGVNWHGQVAAIKWISGTGSGDDIDAIRSVQYANLMGFKITSNSWRLFGYSQALYDAIAAANVQGNIFVAAAGNSYGDSDLYPIYPAAYDLPNIISVAATNHLDQKAGFSNYGATTVDLGAPGENIYSTIPGGNYAYYSGTSMATPHVSGALALLWSHEPSLSPTQAKNQLLEYSDPNPNLVGITVTGKRLNINNLFDRDDTTPPAQVNNLALAERRGLVLSLTWTAVGDDGLSGQASSYDLRYSQSPITEENFVQATAVTGIIGPAQPGTVETMTVNSLNPNSTYYFALKVADNRGNLSPLSNVISVTIPQISQIFTDDVEGMSQWTLTSYANATPSANLWHITQRKATSPTHSWYYGREDTGNYFTPEWNAGAIVSPTISLNEVKYPILSFSYSLINENNAFFDKAVLSISPDNGYTWTDLKQFDPTNGQWTKMIFDLSPYINNQIKLRFSFNTVDAILNEYEGFLVDDIQILGEQDINLPPVANPGGPYTGMEDQPIRLDSSQSFDPEQQPLQLYEWSFGDQDNATTITQGTWLNHNYLRGGTYTAWVKAYDGKHWSAPAYTTVTVTEVNDPPVALGGSWGYRLENEPLNFDASPSTDEEQLPLTYRWDFGDGTTLITASPTLQHTYTSGGSYVVTLVVNDGELDSQPFTMNITILEANEPPIANAGTDQTGFVGQQINFDGSSSSDDEGQITEYLWNFGDSSNGSGATVNHSYTSPGVYRVTLTVVDSNGISSWDSIDVYISEQYFKGEYFSNRYLSGSPVLSRVDQSINFNWGLGSPSSGIGNNNFSIRWTTRQALQAGVYNFTVSHDDGMRIFLNNQLVYNNWGKGSFSNQTVSIGLLTGVYTIRFEYYESNLLAHANVSWQKQ